VLWVEGRTEPEHTAAYGTYSIYQRDARVKGTGRGEEERGDGDVRGIGHRPPASLSYV
jgi:hypothetical protein